MRELSGMVLRIERASIHDGAGLRTVVFLKGCPLTCAWCSTPESQSSEIESAADRAYGRTMSVGDVMTEVEKDKIFFLHSGGGMTLSGGEPLVQADFSAALLKACKMYGINTAMESSLFASFNQLENVLPNLDTLYADLKFADGQKHKEYCGHDNELILKNIRLVTEERHGPLRVIIRIPLIPGINDSDEDLAAAADLCKGLPSVSAVELLPYHRLGVPTYEKLGRSYLLSEIKTPQADYVQNRREYFSSRAKEINIL